MDQVCKEITDILINGEYYKPLSAMYSEFSIKELCKGKTKVTKDYKVLYVNKSQNSVGIRIQDNKSILFKSPLSGYQWDEVRFYQNIKNYENFQFKVKIRDIPYTPTITFKKRRILVTEDCLVCFEKINTTTFVYPCLHTFCNKCIKDWMVIRKACPMCKGDIKFLCNYHI